MSPFGGENARFVLVTSRTLPFAFFLVLNLTAGDLQQLGRQLFFDKRLSADGKISCASCHRPDKAFSDPRRVSLGVHGLEGKLNAPSVMNLQEAKRLFWDGRARSLEQQAAGPLLSAHEMGNSREQLEARIGGLDEYRRSFKRCFGDERVSLERITKAIAAYEKTLASAQSLYDDWRSGKRVNWTSEHEVGRRLFFGQAGCGKCHSGQNFTNQKLVEHPGGRKIRVPSLREAVNTAPYMHDGSIETLLGVLEIHEGGKALDPGDRRALIRFIESLAGEFLR